MSRYLDTGTDFIYEVSVYDNQQNGVIDLTNAYEAMHWLNQHDYIESQDFEVNMHRGQLGYTSFYFHDKDIATKFKLICS